MTTLQEIKANMGACKYKNEHVYALDIEQYSYANVINHLMKNLSKDFFSWASCRKDAQYNITCGSRFIAVARNGRPLVIIWHAVSSSDEIVPLMIEVQDRATELVRAQNGMLRKEQDDIKKEEEEETD